MKKGVTLVIAVLLVLCCVSSACAATFKGTIIDVFGADMVTVRLADSTALQTGEQLQLFYVAGKLPIDIGQFEVAGVQDNIVLAKAVQLNMPAEKGMSVQMEQVAQQSVPAKSPAASQTTPFQAANADQELTGQVVSVDGTQVQIRIEGTESPEIGWYADLYYVTSQGKDLPVGLWQVESVAGPLITANKQSGVGNARTGLKAVLHKPQAATIDNEAVRPMPVVSSTATPVPPTTPATPQPIQLLGQTPVKATQQAAPKTNSSTLPPGVTSTAQTPLNQQARELIELLQSNDMGKIRRAAKIIDRSNKLDSAVYAEVEQALLGNYRNASSNLQVDTMSWLCKALAASGNKDYYQSLRKVYRGTRVKKLKKYAKVSLGELR
nr:hypothetical protein [uncultured Desulfuromonas sp.]